MLSDRCIVERDSDLLLGRLLHSCPELSSVIFKSINSKGLQLIAAHCGPSLRVIEATIYLGSVYDLISLCETCPNLTEGKFVPHFPGVPGDKIVQTIVQYCPLIEVLTMNQWKLTKAAMNALASLNTLKAFQLDDSQKIKSSAIQRVLQANPFISNICLEGPSINAGLISGIGRHCGNLTSLVLDKDAVIDDPALQDLFRGCPLLTVVKLKQRGKLSNTSLTVLFQNCRRLVELDLNVYYVYESDSDAETEPLGLAPVEGDLDLGEPHPTLHTLVLHRQCVHDNAVRALFTTCTSLTDIRLSECDYITDENIKALANSCTMLVKVQLNSNIHPNYTSLLDIAYKCTHLRELVLEYVAVNDQLLVQLSHTCPYLSTLRIGCYTGAITVVGLMALVDRCRQLRSVHINNAQVI